MRSNEEWLADRVQVSRVDAVTQELPFTSPVHLPFGEITTRPSVIVTTELETASGRATGMAEGTSLPIQIPLYDDWSGNLTENVTRLSQELSDTDPQPLRNIFERIARAEVGGTYATARYALEASILDAYSRSRNTTVLKLLQPNVSDTLYVPYGKSITEVDPQVLVQACDDAVRAGASRLKFKISPSSHTAVVSTLITLMRDYPEHAFMVDANGMYDSDNQEHLAMLDELDQMGLMTIEEPVSRVGVLRGLDAHRALQSRKQFDTPITIDDAIKTLSDAEEALNESLADAVNLKPGRMGSFMSCVRVAEYARKRGKQVMVGGMFEATPGRYATTTLAAYCMGLGFTIPGDLSLPQERLSDDLVDERLEYDGSGNIVFNPKKGWGYDVSQ